MPSLGECFPGSCHADPGSKPITPPHPMLTSSVCKESRRTPAANNAPHKFFPIHSIEYQFIAWQQLAASLLPKSSVSRSRHARITAVTSASPRCTFRIVAGCIRPPIK